MESNQAQMYQISKEEQSNNKENVVLRALVGDPNRHKPLAQHPPPTTLAAQEKQPASMYTLETRYRPIPPQVLPKPTESRLYYIEPNQVEEPTVTSALITKEERDTPLLEEPEAPTKVEEEQEPPPIVFLEPKVISQPILYSIVAGKTFPTSNQQPVPANETMPSPIFHSITGDPHRPNTDMKASTLDVATPVISKSPTLYTLVGNPRLQVQFQEPIKQLSKIPQQSSPTLYSVVGNPRLQVQIQEPIKQSSKTPQQSSPTLYSTVGNPTLKPHTILVNTLDASPSTQPVKASPVQAAPILYTVVGKVQVPTNTEKENRPPQEPIKKQTNNVKVHTVVGDTSIPQAITFPRKAQPLQPLKQQQQQQVPTPALYTLVGKLNSPTKEDMNIRPKPPVRRKSPPAVIVPTRRISRSLERRPRSDPATEGFASVPQTTHKHQARSKEPTIPKSETIFIPLREEERPPRRKQPRTASWDRSPEQTNRRPFNISQYDPLRLPNYTSPYAYHPHKGYREHKNYTGTLPALRNNRSERKARPRLYEPHYRPERQHPYSHLTPHSLERYPMNRKERSRLWDFEYQTQTDDDGDAFEPYLSPRNSQYRRIRPRTPWIPVW